MTTMTISKVVQSLAALETLSQLHPVPVNGEVPKDGVAKAPLELSDKARWNLAKNVKLLREDVRQFEERREEIRKAVILDAFGDAGLPPKESWTDEIKAKIAAVEASYVSRVHALEETEIEVDGLRKLPYAGLNVSRNRNFPQAVLPDLLDLIDGEPEESADEKSQK